MITNNEIHDEFPCTNSLGNFGKCWKSSTAKTTTVKPWILLHHAETSCWKGFGLGNCSLKFYNKTPLARVSIWHQPKQCIIMGRSWFPRWPLLEEPSRAISPWAWLLQLVSWHKTDHNLKRWRNFMIRSDGSKLKLDGIPAKMQIRTGLAISSLSTSSSSSQHKSFPKHLWHVDIQMMSHRHSERLPEGYQKNTSCSICHLGKMEGHQFEIYNI